MKKFMMALVCLMTMVVFSSCGSTYEVSANYDVCWPDGTRNYTFENVYEKSSEPTIHSYSIGGTNYLSISGSMDKMNKNPKGKVFVSTTAPIRLNEYSIVKVKKSNKRIVVNAKKKRDDVYMSDILSH